MFKSVNYYGVLNLIEFCKKYSLKLIQISTLSVSGNFIEGGQVIQKNVVDGATFKETDLYIGQDLDNNYAYTKYMAEYSILDEVAKGSLNAKIIRMGNLTGRLTDGKFQPNVEENAFSNRIKTLVNVRMMPKKIYDMYLELTPIDVAAKAVVKIMKISSMQNVYHVFNHNHAMMPFVLENFKELGVDIEVKDEKVAQEEIKEYVKDEKMLKEISGIVMDINKQGTLEYNTNIKVKSDKTIQLLKRLEFEYPIVTKKYFKQYIKYLEKIGFLKIDK